MAAISMPDMRQPLLWLAAMLIIALQAENAPRANHIAADSWAPSNVIFLTFIAAIVGREVGRATSKAPARFLAGKPSAKVWAGLKRLLNGEQGLQGDHHIQLSVNIGVSTAAAGAPTKPGRPWLRVWERSG